MVWSTECYTERWRNIDSHEAEVYVRKLQARIVKAQREGRHSKVKSLQWLLTHSFYGRYLAVLRVTTNKGKDTAGVDHVRWSTDAAKVKAIDTLKRRGYQPMPLRRMEIPKKKWKETLLGNAHNERQSDASSLSDGTRPNRSNHGRSTLLWFPQTSKLSGCDSHVPQCTFKGDRSQIVRKLCVHTVSNPMLSAASLMPSNETPCLVT